MRLISKDSIKFTIPASMVSGSVLLLIADTVSRSVLDAGELPVGVVTASIGAPLFIYLLVKRHAIAG